MNKNLWLTLVLCASTWALTQQPQVSNTQFKSEPASSGLSATVDRFLSSKQALWLGYEVPILPRTHISSCPSRSDAAPVADGCCGEYQLEQDNDNLRTNDQGGTTNSSAYVLLRLEDGRVTKVRAAMAGCRLNAGGVPFHWLTAVQPDDSAEFLGKLAAQNVQAKDHNMDQVLAVLSMHATSKATNVLAGLAAPANSPKLREKAAFWLGAQRGHEGYLVLRQLLSNETDSKFREKLAFDFFVNSDPAVVDELIKLAKSDPDAGVRGQAIFWLAQKAGKKATVALNDALDNDPELHVKKKAVFALSQLPKDEAIPQLVRVANTNSSPAIRKEAIFWLGQSNDPRALQFLEEILKR